MSTPGPEEPESSWSFCLLRQKLQLDQDPPGLGLGPTPIRVLMVDLRVELNVPGNVGDLLAERDQFKNQWSSRGEPGAAGMEKTRGRTHLQN